MLRLLLVIWSVIVEIEVGIVPVGGLLVCVLDGRVRLPSVHCLLGLHCLLG